MTTKSNTSQNKLVETLKSFAASALIAAITFVFFGISLKACEAEQAAQIERAKAHQAMLNEVAK